MVILGIADGLDSGAALVVGGEVVATTTQASLDRTPRSRAMPWPAATDVLEASGLGRRDVDLVAVAGRFSPPLFLRRYPGLRDVVGRDPFSPALDAHVAYQAVLRWTGFGAFQEDRTAAWFMDVLRRRGFDPRRVVMVDRHRALADAAYRSQPHDDVLALTAQPKADGASLAVFLGRGGMLLPRFRDAALSVLHSHLQRCTAAVGLDPVGDLPLLWAEAGRGRADPDLVDRLARRLTTVGRRTSWRPPMPDDVAFTTDLYDRLREVPVPVAAASLLENLVDALGGVVRTHVLRHGARRVVLGGALFDNPRLVARIAEGLDVDEVFTLPEPGTRSMPLGAATDQGGVAPRRVPGPGLGRRYDATQCALALEAASLVPEPAGDPLERAAAVLAAGGAVARFQGPGGGGAWGNGARTVLVRADDPAAVDRAREALGRDPREEPGCVWDGAGGSLSSSGKMAHALALGAVAPRADRTFQEAHPAVVAPDGRVLARRVLPEDEPDLAELIDRVRARTGCGALAGWALGLRREPPAARPGDAVRVWRGARLDALLLGPHLVTR